MDNEEKDIYDSLEKLMDVSPRISVAFCELTYFKNVVNFIPPEELNKIETLYDFMYKNEMIDGDFIQRYKYLKTMREHKRYFDIANSMGKKIIICKN